MISGKEVKCSGSPSYDDTMDMTIFLLFKIRGDTVHMVQSLMLLGSGKMQIGFNGWHPLFATIDLVPWTCEWRKI